VQRELWTVQESDQHVWYDSRKPAAIGLAKPSLDLIDACTSARHRQANLFR
jgi:hypothetical protein